MKHICALLLLTLSLTPARAQDGWLHYRGDLQRTGAASDAKPWDKRVAWQRPLFGDVLDGFKDPDEDAAAKALVEKLRKDADPTILPAAFPIIVGDVTYYRSSLGVASVAVQPTKVTSEENPKEAYDVPAGHILWKSFPHFRSLALMQQKHDARRALDRTVALLQATKQERLLWANGTIGTLNSDGKMIHAIDDAAFPPLEFPAKGTFKDIADKEREFGPIKQLVKENLLCGYGVLNGKLVWDSEAEPRFAEGHFLGVPTPVAGKLFGLFETKGELRLVRMNGAGKLINMDRAPDLEAALEITKVPADQKILASPLRRTQALHLAVAGDTLVCPTHAGIVVGVDRAKFEVRWTYRYRDEKAAPPKLPAWQAVCPIIAKERIVFTAADAPDVHCIDFAGKKQWTAKADDDLYLATVHADLVLLVGKKECRALNLKDGTERWRLEIGLPAGVGVKDGGVYYLPLKVDAEKKAPALWAIDILKGKKLHTLEVPYPDALGNLALHRGLFVSQSVTHVAAFPLAAAK